MMTIKRSLFIDTKGMMLKKYSKTPKNVRTLLRKREQIEIIYIIGLQEMICFQNDCLYYFVNTLT